MLKQCDRLCASTTHIAAFISHCGWTISIKSKTRYCVSLFFSSWVAFFYNFYITRLFSNLSFILSYRGIIIATYWASAHHASWYELYVISTGWSNNKDGDVPGPDFYFRVKWNYYNKWNSKEKIKMGHTGFEPTTSGTWRTDGRTDGHWLIVWA